MYFSTSVSAKTLSSLLVLRLVPYRMGVGLSNSTQLPREGELMISESGSVPSSHETLLWATEGLNDIADKLSSSGEPWWSELTELERPLTDTMTGTAGLVISAKLLAVFIS